MKNQINLPNFKEDTDINYGGNLPRQKILRRYKTSDWYERCTDAVIHSCNVFSFDRRSPYATKVRNYNVFNNKISDLDFSYITNPFPFPTSSNGTYELPARIQPLDVLSPNFMLLIGEEGKRLFSPIVRSVNADSIQSKEDAKALNILQVFQEHIKSYIEQNPETEEVLMKKLQKYSTYSAKDLRESQAQHLLTYLMKHEHLNQLFDGGWKDFLVAGEEIYYIDEVNGAGKVRRVNPLEIYYVLPNNYSKNHFLDECERIYERNRMTISEVVDEFYEVLTPDQIDDLEAHQYGSSTMYDYTTPHTLSSMGVGVNGVVSGIYNETAGLPINLGIGTSSLANFMNGDSRPGIDVHRSTWKGKRKKYVLHYIDPMTNKEEEMVMDESFKIDKNNPDQWVETFWVNEYYHQVRIGADMYLPGGPKKHQFRSIDSLSECKSGYVGTVCSADNSMVTSLMDRVIPWLYYYLTVWYRTELLLAKNFGRIVDFDLSLMPDGWTVEKTMYYAVALGFKPVDSYAESKKGERHGTVNQSTVEGKELNFDTSEAVQRNIVLLDFLERKIEDTLGITRQRKGQIMASDSVGGTERATVQSSYITEPYFATHNYTKLRVLDAFLKVTQECIEDGSKAYQYVTDDMQEIYGIINGSELSDVDFETFISNSPKDQRIIEAMENMIQHGLQNDKINFSQIADVIGSESIADMKNALKQAEDQRAQQIQANEEMKNNLAKMIHDEDMASKQADRDSKEFIAEQNNTTKIAVAQIGNYFKAADTDTDQDGIPDPIEIGKLSLEQQKLAADAFNKQQETNLKNKDLEIKKQIEDKKIQAIKTQNFSQEKIAKEANKLKEKEMENKLKIEKIKARNKPKSK